MSELNLILIGPPGAGKGTQAENIKEDFHLPYLATGDMMRAKRKEDSDLGRKIDRIINEGGLVDDGALQLDPCGGDHRRGDRRSPRAVRRYFRNPS